MERVDSLIRYDVRVQYGNKNDLWVIERVPMRLRIENVHRTVSNQISNFSMVKDYSNTTQDKIKLRFNFINCIKRGLI